MAVQYFFNLALAQINREIAQTNMMNADTLYQIAKGRYNLGTIAENELLQMELSYLNAGTAINESEITLKDRELKLRSFLGFNQNVRLELIIPSEIPALAGRDDRSAETCRSRITRNFSPLIFSWSRLRAVWPRQRLKKV